MSQSAAVSLTGVSLSLSLYLSVITHLLLSWFLLNFESFLYNERHSRYLDYNVFKKYGSGKCVSSTFIASQGTGTSMNALDIEANSRLWQCPQTREKK